MTFPDSKRLRLALAVAAILLALCLFLFVYYLTLGAFDGAYRRAPLSLSVWEKDTCILNEEHNAPLAAGEHTLTLQSDEDMTVCLFFDGKPLATVTVTDGATDCVVTLPEKGYLSLTAEGGETPTAWILSPSDFSLAAERLANGGDFVFLRSVTLGDVSLSAPCRLFGHFSLNSLVFSTQEQGRLVLSPSTAFAACFYADAPLCDVYYQDVTTTFSSESADYYWKVRHVNGMKMNPVRYPITTAEELSRLADPALLPHFSAGGEICVLSALSLTQDLHFSGEASLVLNAPVFFGEHRMTFSHDGEGVYRVQTAKGVSLSADSLVFSAPWSYLYWTGEGSIPLQSTVEKTSNLAYFNGTPTRLGGVGTARPVLILSADQHEAFSEDVLFTADGNLLVAELPYEISLSDLDAMQYRLACPNGTVRLEGTLSEGVIVATDESGLERRYALFARREGYQIPVVHLETENGAEILSKSQYVTATFSMDGNSSYASVQEMGIRIRGRGNSTWKWEKKPYKIHFDEKISLFGLPAAEEWALFANYADKSLMRNHIAQVMASQLSFSYVPSQVFVDVFLNGEYVGLYCLGEHLEEGEGRVEISHDIRENDCGFFLEAGGVVSGVDVKGMNYFHADLLKFVLIKSPDYNALTSEQFSYIQQYVTELSRRIREGDGYEEYLDMDTFLDWLIMIEFTNNIDCAYRRSTYLVKNAGEKIQMGPLWDFDLAFGNFSRDNPAYDEWISFADDDYVGTTWSTYLFEDPAFQAAFRARWEEVGDTLLETALSQIEENYRLLSPSADENFKRWDVLGKKVAFEPQSTTQYKTYFSQIEYLRDFLVSRHEWITQQVSAW